MIDRKEVSMILATALVLINFAQASVAESIRIEHTVKDRVEDKILLNENTLDYNGTTKQLPEVLADKYRAEILHALPIAAPSTDTCVAGDRWLVQIGTSSRDYCKDEKALAFLRKMTTKVKVIIR